MNYDITKLNNNIEKSILVDEIYSFTKESLKGTDLISLDNVKINGEIFKNSLGNIELDLSVEGIMILPCAVTLKPVEYPFSIEINGEFNDLMGENSTNFKNTIDILPIIWENILMEIPMRVVSPDAEDITLEGDGWIYNSKEEDDNNPFKELLNMNSEVK